MRFNFGLRQKFHLSLCVIIGSLLTMPVLAVGTTSSRKLLAGQMPDAVAHVASVGQLSASTHLKLSISLPLRNQTELTNLLAQIYDPASPLYHHYLSPDEFDAQFGPTEQDYEAVAAFATSNGFTIVGRHPNRMMLEVDAAVPDIERAFQVTMRNYQHPTEPRTFFAPDADPSLVADVPILSIGGLDNFSRPRPTSLHRTPLVSTNGSRAQIGSGQGGNLIGSDFRAAYLPGVSLAGTGQSVGLVEFDAAYTSDITNYEGQAGLTNVPLQVLLFNGFNGVPTTGANSGNGEVALDIEMAVAMAPALAKVVVYEADPVNGQLNTVLQAMSTNTAVKQFSCSWSVGPISSAQRTTMDNYFLKFATQGQSFFDASGDSGAYTTTPGAPDDDPNITLVGGTTLGTAGPKGAWLSETAWNAGEGPGFAGTGGGLSTTYGIPAWQLGAISTASGGSKTARNSPDVAMVADNLFLVADNGQNESSGGTSGSAPLWAAYTALINQRAVALGQSTVGFLNPALYHIGTNATYAACFDDITAGNNTNANTTQFKAVPGYDLCTGLGTEVGDSLMLALTKPDGFLIAPARGVVANGPTGGPFNVTSQTFGLSNSGNGSFGWTIGCTSSWVTVSSANGILTAGGATSPVTVAMNSGANLLSNGVYTANIWFTNLTSGAVQLRQFTVQVGQDLVLDGSFEAADFCYWNLNGDVAVYTNNFVDNGTATGYTPESGAYFAALGQVGNLAYLNQSLSTHPGQRYLISVWLENPSGQTPNEFQIQWNTNATSTNVVFDQVNMGTFSWSNLLVTVTSTTNLTTLQFGFRNDADAFGMDNVHVIPIPVPAIESVAIVSHSIQLNWTALAKVRYQVQSTTSLSPPSWVNVGSVVTATSSTMTAFESMGTSQAQFYRVIVP